MFTASVLALVLATPWLADDDNNRPSLGILGIALDNPEAQNLLGPLFGASKPAVRAGYIVLHVDADGPSDRKLKTDDIITSFNGKPVKTAEDISALLKAAGIGKECRIAGRRKGSAGRWVPFDTKVTSSTALITAKFAMTAERDEVRRLTITRHRGESLQAPYTGIVTYLSTKDGGDPLVFLRVRYRGEKWVFFKKCTFRIDDEVITLEPTDVQRDNGDGKVWEHADFVVTKDVESLLRKLNSAHATPILRLEGDDGVVDHYITDATLDHIEQVAVVAKSVGFVAK